ncbi:uncharacterized protein [Macrobrachium rosenbergii]|uniref:uncharacterized protein n=1 Tax=Macrobrachium rosenbergii TaxID=79674 RepID=UPI0034D68D95
MDLLHLILENQHDPELVKGILNFHNAMLQLRIPRCMEERQLARRSIDNQDVAGSGPTHDKKEKGYYDNLMQELATENTGLYRNFIRIMEDLFDEIVECVTPYMKKTLTFWRRPIEPGLCVAIALRYLATGESYKSLPYQFRVAANTICSIVPETCRAIVATYGGEVMQVPSTPEEWKEVALGFEE